MSDNPQLSSLIEEISETINKTREITRDSANSDRLVVHLLRACAGLLQARAELKDALAEIEKTNSP